MTAIPGVTIKKNSKGKLTHVTIDVRKHQQALPVLKDLGLMPKSQFDIDFENGVSVEDLKESLFAHIKKRYADNRRTTGA